LDLDQCLAIDQRSFYLRPACFKPVRQYPVAGIADAKPDNAQTVGAVSEWKIIILGHENATLADGKFGDDRIRSFAAKAIRDMNGLMPPRRQPDTKTGRQLRVNKEFHAAALTILWSTASAA
jgi:hypothetical protein